MYKDKKILGLINARGGSKGVPGKNIKPMNGKPLIAYSIEAGLGCTLIDRLIVSTDDPKIADVARAHGADVPFMRPPELATDKAKQIDAIIHAIRFVEQQGEEYDYLCLLQPTCPMRTAEDAEGALRLLIDSKADSVITITEVGGRHPRTLYKLDPNGHKLTPYLESSSSGVLRQDFEDLYWRTGGVYAMRIRIPTEENSLYGNDTRGYIVPEERCFNIDSPFDWDLCEAYMRFKS